MTVSVIAASRAVCLAVLAMAGAKTAHAASDCARILPNAAAPARVMVRLSTPPPIYSRKTQAQLNGMTVDAVVRGAGSRNGVTRTEMRLQATTSFVMATLPQGGVCARPDRVDITVVTTIAVDIIDRYDVRSCAYAAIRAHEDEHVSFAHQVSADYLSVLQTRLTQGVQETGAFFSKDQQSASRLFERRLEQLVRPVFDAQGRALASLNRSIDTRESYQAVMRKCSDW